MAGDSGSIMRPLVARGRSSVGGRAGTLHKVLGALALVLVAACAGAPVVRTLPEFREAALKGKRVAFLRLAVSDDLGDARTGIVMSARTRTLATQGACESVSQQWDVGRVVCLIPDEGLRSGELLELERLYAEARPVPPSLLTAIQTSTKSDFILLFRPESVGSVQEISQSPGSRNDFWRYSGGSTIRTENETELSYTVSALLIDLETMKPVRGGQHSGNASRTVKNNVGFAAAPPAASLLAEIMSELGKAVLED
jgi:hypothetical protein